MTISSKIRHNDREIVKIIRVNGDTYFTKQFAGLNRFGEIVSVATIERDSENIKFDSNTVHFASALLGSSNAEGKELVLDAAAEMLIM